jgi:hypothetical protein
MNNLDKIYNILDKQGVLYHDCNEKYPSSVFRYVFKIVGFDFVTAYYISHDELCDLSLYEDIQFCVNWFQVGLLCNFDIDFVDKFHDRLDLSQIHSLNTRISRETREHISLYLFVEDLKNL